MSCAVVLYFLLVGSFCAVRSNWHNSPCKHLVTVAQSKHHVTREPPVFSMYSEFQNIHVFRVTSAVFISVRKIATLPYNVVSTCIWGPWLKAVKYFLMGAHFSVSCISCNRFVSFESFCGLENITCTGITTSSRLLKAWPIFLAPPLQCVHADMLCNCLPS